MFALFTCSACNVLPSPCGVKLKLHEKEHKNCMRALPSPYGEKLKYHYPFQWL